MVAGVLGGVAQYFGWDPTVVRAVYVVFSIVSVAFPGILVYLALWFGFVLGTPILLIAGGLLATGARWSPRLVEESPGPVS